MTLYELLALLKDVKPGSGGNYLACCPAHDDKKQSLSVKEGDKGIVVKCYAGCGVRDICAKLGIEMKDLFFEKPKEAPKQRAPRKIVKTYPYTDEEGRLLFEVVRYEPKDFSQRMPDPENPGKWIWKHCPIQVLYRLPEVIKQIKAGGYVAIAEGEKDAETLTRLGYCGTTIAMGAGKWRQSHTDELKGARVLLFADNDEAGRSHMWDVGQHIMKGVVKECRYVQLKEVWPEMPEKGDVSDLAEKFGDEKAKELIESAIAKAVKGGNPSALTPDEAARIHDDTEAGKLFSKVDGYTVKDGCICQFTGDGGVKRLSTFSAIPRKTLRQDDGESIQTAFEIEGFGMDGRKLGTALVPSSEFQRMEWALTNWGFRASLMPGNTVKDKVRYAISQVGVKTAKSETVYVHTGWRKIEGELMYLHGGGAIGGEDVRVQLEGKLGGYDLSAECETDGKECAELPLRFMEVMTPEAAYPLLGVAFLAPLISFLKKKGIAPRFALYLLGMTQSGKTTAAMLALSFFGRFSAMDSIPASFTDTANSVQRSAFLLKDMPLLIDDYFPVSSVNERRKMEFIAQTLSRSFGNAQSRGRLDSSMKQRAGLVPRCVAIMTGEDIPDIKESGLARFFIVDVRKGDVSMGEELTKLQEAAARGELVKHMRGYIEYLRGRAEELPEKLYQSYLTYRREARKQLKGSSARAAEAVAELLLGLEYMVRYRAEAGYSSEEEGNELLNTAYDVLISLSKGQAAEARTQKPTTQFINTLRERLAAGEWKCADLNDPKDGGLNIIGYQDQDFYYFLPESAYRAVSKFCADQGKVFPVNLLMLKKALVEDGIIAQGMADRQKKVRGRNQRLIWVARGIMDGKKEKEAEMEEAEEAAPFEDEQEEMEI